MERKVEAEKGTKIQINFTLSFIDSLHFPLPILVTRGRINFIFGCQFDEILCQMQEFIIHGIATHPKGLYFDTVIWVQGKVTSQIIDVDGIFGGVEKAQLMPDEVQGFDFVLDEVLVRIQGRNIKHAATIQDHVCGWGQINTADNVGLLKVSL